MKGSNPKATTKVQVQAKDALFALRDVADANLRKSNDAEVLRWILADLQERSLGEHSAEKIITTIGVPAGNVLAEQIAVDPNLVVAFATHLRSVGDQAARDNGATKLIELAKRQTDGAQLGKTIEGVGKVGSLRAVSYLAEIAKKGSFEQRKLALRALALYPHVSVVELARGIAADSSLKGEEAELRDDAFTLLEKIADPKSMEALLSLLALKEEKARYQAVEAVVGGFKEKGLTKLLEAFPSSYTYKKEDIKDYVEEDIVKLGKAALPAMRQALQSQSWVARVVAIRVLGRIGTKEDAPALEKLSTDSTKLRGWGAGATIGTEAKAAAQSIQSRK
jgi:HEAT repeat protein